MRSLVLDCGTRTALQDRPDIGTVAERRSTPTAAEGSWGRTIIQIETARSCTKPCGPTRKASGSGDRTATAVGPITSMACSGCSIAGPSW